MGVLDLFIVRLETPNYAMIDGCAACLSLLWNTDKLTIKMRRMGGEREQL